MSGQQLAESAAAAEAASPMSPSTPMERGTRATDIVEFAFRRGQLDGTEPFVESFSLESSAVIGDLLPGEAALIASSTTETQVAGFARFPGGSILVKVFSKLTLVEVSATNPVDAAQVAEAIRSRAPQLPTADNVSLRTWRLNSCNDSAIAEDRRVAAPSWNEVAANYPTAVRQELKQLVEMDDPVGTGKLILWHGEPGTGKTTAIRALIREWAPWCAAQYVSDPERLFANPGYISELLTRPTGRRQSPTLDRAGEPDALWRLIIAEDTDEYLRASARRDAGVGLGRLLNLADGLLGQGFKCLILLTTNEELSRLHPAVTRPGRCLAKVEFKRFSPAESRSWLPDEVASPKEPSTLAELFELRGDIARIGESKRSTPLLTGTYV